jgi:hypothetical protein
MGLLSALEYKSLITFNKLNSTIKYLECPTKYVIFGKTKNLERKNVQHADAAITEYL